MVEKIKVGLPLDDSGFLRRECPYCKREFKIEIVENEENATEDSSSSELYCCYCGQSAPCDEYFTPAQCEYLKNILAKEVMEPALKDFQQGLTRLNRPGGFTRFKASPINIPEPYIAPDDDDMHILSFPCCNIRLKLDSAHGTFYCAECGGTHVF